MKNVKRFLAGAALLVLLASILHGQSMSATIIGNVKDAAGGYLAGVTVTAVNVGTNAALTVTTDKREGAFRLLGLAPGIYQVSFDLAGYQSYVASGIRLYAEQSFLLRVQLDRIGVKKAIATAAGSMADAPDRPRVVPIVGVVAEADGKYLPGAEVTAVNLSTQAAVTVVTDNIEGAFRLLTLAPGPYQVRFACQGYAPYTVGGIQLIAGQPFLLHIRLAKDKTAEKEKNVPAEPDALGPAGGPGRSPGARIIGSVRSSGGEYLSGVKVTAVHAGTLAATTVISDEKEGAFRLFGLPEGTYQVSFELHGYVSHVAGGVRLSATRPSILRVRLVRTVDFNGQALISGKPKFRLPVPRRIGVKAGVNLSTLSIFTGRTISRFEYWTKGADPWHGGLSWQVGFFAAFPIGNSFQFAPELLLASYRSHLKGDFEDLEVDWTLARTQLQVPLLFQWLTSTRIVGGRLFFLLGPQIVFNLGSDLKLSVDGSETETDITDKYVRNDFCFVGGCGVEKPLSSGKTRLAVELRFCLSVKNQSAAPLSRHKQNAVMLLAGVSF